MAWAAAAFAIGKEIADQASGAISAQISALIASAEQILPEKYGKAYFTQLNTRKIQLYTGAAKDLTSSLWNDANAGNDVAMTVASAANAAKIPAHYRYKLRASAFQTFGNTKKAQAEEALAKANPPPSSDIVETVRRAATDPTMIALGVAALAIFFMTMKKKT